MVIRKTYGKSSMNDKFSSRHLTLDNRSRSNQGDMISKGLYPKWSTLSNVHEAHDIIVNHIWSFSSPRDILTFGGIEMSNQGHLCLVGCVSYTNLLY